MVDVSHRFDIIYKTFATRALAKNEPTSKLAFARFMGASQGRMQSWERGQLPRPDDLQRLHETLGFSYHWLMTGEGDPFGAPTDTTTAELLDRIAALEAELNEANRLNRKLAARLLVDGVGDNAAASATGKASDGHG